MLERQVIIKELEEKINELNKLSKQEAISVDDEIQTLEKKLSIIKEERWKGLTPWERVQLARMSNRLTSLDYIENIFDHFIEFHGDRLFKDDPSIVGGIAMFNGTPVTVIGQQKGRNTKDNIKRNFGMPNPEGYRKALRLMKQAEKFNRPIICLVDTPGAFCGLGAEERGQGEAIAKNLFEMSQIKVPMLSIVIGEGGSGGALALAVTDEVWMLENSIYSILSPEGFASILWKDSSRAKEAADVMKITAEELKVLKIIDRVISEPIGGVQENPQVVFEALSNGIDGFLEKSRSLSKDEIISSRYERFRKFGME
ncbi:acetyl-CoA carboxylase carboxyltransferase subunit alpha [Natranaerovirga pectinivora]|uniref:Acetyl-coenzyme A carboxylase carboxyl transferase subunit alpha n=1 Tax=Natranaerovirga pectinivora TaxID=682400 RepID=A0A4R3MGI2_9FIRM|nr:acetyl-CoA carboxylase carboxyltransferase subunit alpha [Natranaerovirga pectinivora]TCT12299.1 acetyl-CoA carboxylase carboxyltransferase subunit alpha [Natranaerovirga pectinivora]